MPHSGIMEVIMIAKDRFELGEAVLPRLVPEPCWCRGITEPVTCLDGEWEVQDYKDGGIRKIKVPFDMVVLRKKGFSRHYEYRREIILPNEAEGNRIILKFEGVNGFAQVYVDGEAVASHQNGFLTWNVEITKQTKGKKKVTLKVAMDEESDKVSAYSHGGILRSVYLYVLPEAYVNAVYLTPLFDEDMDTCTLRADLDISGKMAETQADEKQEDRYEAVLQLYGPEGGAVTGKRVRLDVREDGYYSMNLPVSEPKLWDAEHPVLYTLEIDLYRNGEKLETVKRRTGLRRLERKGNRLFVNKHEVKLRGVCRHEISPRCGRALTRELIEQDVDLFKEANCNYIRTSHYPPSEYFLDQCDEKGIYVEDELALAFIARTLPYTQRDPEETERYLSHFTECMARDYNHPSVIIWSLCNESFGGHNFDLLNQYVHRLDPTRMTKFSYPMTMREEHEMPDIWSIHYSEYDTDLAKKRDNVSVGHAPGKDMPVLHDEYVHVACYNREELRRDPSVRSFWGEGIRIFWDNIWNTEGALGGAIWAGIDETDIYDGGNTQLEWGIIDVWRRKKPEFYMTRKAYSPIKVLHYQGNPEEDKLLLIVENRFSHTDLSEVQVAWKSGEHEGSCSLPAAGPGRTVKAVISLEPGILSEGRPVKLTFLDACKDSVDEIIVTEGNKEEKLLVEEKEHGQKDGCTERITVQRLEQETVLTGKDFTMSFSNAEGLLKGLWIGEKRLLMGGPILNVPYLKLGEWYLNSMDCKETSQGAEVIIHGGYRRSIELTWKITVTPSGEFTTQYHIDRLEKGLPKQLKLRVGVDCGGLDELGVAYLADPSMDTLSWRRSVNADQEGSYTWYPEDHISRNTGTADRYSQGSIWGEQPNVSWGMDMKNDILNGYYDVEYKGTNDFRSTKENAEEAYLYSGQDRAAIGVTGNGTHIRVETVEPEELKITDRDERLCYTGTWYPVEDKKESDHGTEMWSRDKGSYAECTFEGTGIVWYGPQDTTYGMANVYIDGKLAAEKLSQRVPGVDFSCSSVGYDKKYHIPIFSVTDLPYGVHTIRIEVCGEKAEDASDYYIVIDYLRILNGERAEPVKLIMNQEYSFPHLSWGNYVKPPILIKDGTTGTVTMKSVNLREESVRGRIDAAIRRSTSV